MNSVLCSRVALFDVLVRATEKKRYRQSDATANGKHRLIKNADLPSRAFLDVGIFLNSMYLTTVQGR
jgi:hypothetical protein